MHYTRHAEVRCQQRGIPAAVVNVLLMYGEQRYHRGASICFMNQVSRERAKNKMGHEQFAKIADRLNSYVVLAENGDIITAAPRLRRLKF
jgi:hypothetical protein